MPVILGIERILNGSKTAVLLPALAGLDRVQRQPGGPWQLVDQIVIGESVHEVRRPMLTTTCGELLTVRALLPPKRTIYVLVTEIVLVRPDQLTTVQRAALGPPDLRWGVDLVEAMKSRPGWWVAILPSSNALPL
jgi:hypothetical protein